MVNSTHPYPSPWHTLPRPHPSRWYNLEFFFLWNLHPGIPLPATILYYSCSPISVCLLHMSVHLLKDVFHRNSMLFSLLAQGSLHFTTHLPSPNKLILLPACPEDAVLGPIQPPTVCAPGPLVKLRCHADWYPTQPRSPAWAGISTLPNCHSANPMTALSCIPPDSVSLQSSNSPLGLPPFFL